MVDYLMVFGSDDLFLFGYVVFFCVVIVWYLEVVVFQLGVCVIDEYGVFLLFFVDWVKQCLFCLDIWLGDVEMQGECFVISFIWGNWLYWFLFVFCVDVICVYDFCDDLFIVFDLVIFLDIVFVGGLFVVIDDEVFVYCWYIESVLQKVILDGMCFMDDCCFFFEIV